MVKSRFWKLLLEAGAEHDRELEALRHSQLSEQTNQRQGQTSGQPEQLQAQDSAQPDSWQPQVSTQSGLLHLGEEVLESHSPPQACHLDRQDSLLRRQARVQTATTPFDPLLTTGASWRPGQKPEVISLTCADKPGAPHETVKSWQPPCLPVNPCSSQPRVVDTVDEPPTNQKLNDIDRHPTRASGRDADGSVQPNDVDSYPTHVSGRESVRSVHFQDSHLPPNLTSDPDCDRSAEVNDFSDIASNCTFGVYGGRMSEQSSYPHLFELREEWKVSWEPVPYHSRISSKFYTNLTDESPVEMTNAESVASKAFKDSFQTMVWSTSTKSFRADHDDDDHFRWMSHPSSRARIAWDMFSMFFVAYDFVFIPLQLFPLAAESGVEIFEWFPRLFWTVDILYSFFVGYHYRGHVIMSLPLVARHYLRTWFIPDVVIVSSDWIFYFMVQIQKESSNIGNMARMFRLSRNMRSLRLLRLAKLRYMMKEIQDRIDSMQVSTYVRIATILLLLLAINHVVACFWYGISEWSREHFSDFKHWIQEHGYANESVGFLYAASLHWSLCQFTPAPNPIHPHNLVESIFAILVVLMAMIVFSSFVSQITAFNAQIWQARAHASNQLWLLRRFLKKSGVSTKVFLKVQRFLEYETELQMQHVREQDIQVLNLLSTPLRNELTLELYDTFLQRNDHFSFLKNAYSRKVYLKLWEKVLTRMPLATGDALFFRGETPGGMYCLTSGLLQYKRRRTMKRLDVTPGTWACEGELWTNWVTIGHMRAATESSLIKVDCKRLSKNIQAIPEAFRHAKVFGMQFINALNDASADEITDLELSLERIPFHRS